MSKSFEMNKCPWECIGENTSTFVWWCAKCGSIVDEDGRNLQNPSNFNTDNTLYCPDQGLVP